MRDNRNSTRKIKNKILAIEAAPDAIPPNPKIAAIIAITRKITVQRNIVLDFRLLNVPDKIIADPNKNLILFEPINEKSVP
jgi:hypothetical protein